MSNANPNYIHLKKQVPDHRITLLQGGTRSGKTFSVIYYLIYLCKRHRGLEIDLVRDTFTALKATAWKDFKDVLQRHNIYKASQHQKSEHFYNLYGNIISYYGADNPDKIHGRSRDILWVNEAHQFPEETIDQLFPRTRHRIICDYNPALGIEHWLDPYIEQYPPMITTYQDNPHLTKAQISDIESKKDNRYWWSVYGSGKRAKQQGVIFENWEIGEFDDSLAYVFGQDYGYYPDPTTLVKVAIDKKNRIIYLKEYLYKTHLSTGDIIRINTEHIKKNDLIIADSAEPRLIQEMRKHGINMQPAKKGPDSVRKGIMDLQQYKFIVDPESRNLQKELSNYVWNDKRSSTPIDDWNHLIDPIRYVYQYLNERPEVIFK